MRYFTEKRKEKLDEQISVYSCLRKLDDAVVIQMSPDLLSELIAYDHAVMLLGDGIHPHRYKGCDVILASGESFLSIAYINTKTGLMMKYKEIKEENE